MQVGVDVTFLVGVAILVSEIQLLSKMAKFSFRTMGYSPWSSKNLINRNQLKKFMQVGVDVACMYTNFGGHDLSGFGDIATFKNGQIFLSNHGPWSPKNLIDRNWLKKFMQVDIDVTCMYTNLMGVTFPVSEILLLLKMVKFPFRTMGYSPWSPKNLIDWNWLKNFMQVGIDVTCMHANFDGHDLSGFRDIATFKNSQIFLSDHGLYSPWSSKNFI